MTLFDPPASLIDLPGLIARDNAPCLDCGHKSVSHGSYLRSGIFNGIGRGQCGMSPCVCASGVFK